MEESKPQKTSFLIAMPSLKESLFSHSVILMAEKSSTGALGFIINLPTGTMVADALSMLKFQNKQNFDIPILFGGPVQTDFFWVLHAPDFSAPTTLNIHDKISLSSAMDILPILDSDDCPRIFHAGVGYSGWGVDQLDREIQEGSWWLDNFDLDLLLKVPHKLKWDYAFESLGADPSQLIDTTNPSNPTIN